MACISLTVPNSGTVAAAGSTAQAESVTSDDGYVSLDGNQFTATCEGVSPGASEWTNALSCDGKSFALLVYSLVSFCAT